QKRENVKDTYDAIIEDYQFCIDNTEGAQTSVYQISHTAAKAFLAEALIMRQADGDMQRVITLANEILLSGHFLMEPTFEAIFVPSNDYRPSRELLFSRALNTQVLGDILSGTGSFSYRVFHNAVGSGGVVYY